MIRLTTHHVECGLHGSNYVDNLLYICFLREYAFKRIKTYDKTPTLLKRQYSL